MARGLYHLHSVPINANCTYFNEYPNPQQNQKGRQGGTDQCHYKLGYPFAPVAGVEIVHSEPTEKKPKKDERDSTFGRHCIPPASEVSASVPGLATLHSTMNADSCLCLDDCAA